MIRRKILTLLLTLLLFPALCFAFQPEEFMQFSDVKTADAQILDAPGWLYGIVVATDATNAVTFITYDNTAASGSKAHPDWIAPTSSTNRMSVLSFDPPVEMQTGIYVDITTSGTASYVIYFRRY